MRSTLSRNTYLTCNDALRCCPGMHAWHWEFPVCPDSYNGSGIGRFLALFDLCINMHPN